MSYSRERPNAGRRCPGHDYRSKCIYHIVLQKAEGFPLQSEVAGFPGNHQWPPCVRRSVEGEIIKNEIYALKNVFPFTSVIRQCVMPDHVHFALNIKEATDVHLGSIIAELKRKCSEAYEKLGHEPGVLFFTPGYHDTFLSGAGQLQAMLAYISDNPRRHLVRKGAPGWFRRFVIGSPYGSERFEAYGNWDLLEEPHRVAVKVSRKYSPQELIAHKHHWLDTVNNDGVLVSPFINPAEKRCRDWAIENGGAFIYLTYAPFGERFKPQGRLFELCSQGRLLIVSVPPDEKAREYIRANGHPPYSFCQRMNALAAEIAAHPFRIY